MNCEKIKELILTDFSDNRLSKETQEQIRRHLQSCAGCREFADAVNRDTVKPFNQAQKAAVPEYLWYRIKDSIVNEKPKPALSGLFENLHLLFRPRPMFAMATIASVVIIAAVFFTPYLRHNEVNRYLNEQMDFVSYLGQNGNGSSEIELGTAGEEFLL